MLDIHHIFPLLQQPRKVVITTHQKPDGDAMGSSLGLYHFLNGFGHQVTVISPTNWATFLNWMPSCKKVLDYDMQTDKADVAIAEAEWIFCLDFNTLGRTKNMAEKLLAAKAERI